MCVIHVCMCIIIWDMYACRFMLAILCVHATLRDEKPCIYIYKIIKIILWFILDLIRCNVYSCRCILKTPVCSVELALIEEILVLCNIRYNVI